MGEVSATGKLFYTETQKERAEERHGQTGVNAEICC